mgnify:FL=1
MPFTVLSSGVKLHYQVVNEKGSEGTILFLHEALGSIDQWKDFPEILCEKTNLKGIVYERQGYGKSSAELKERGVDYLHNYALEELPQFLEALKINGPVHLFGHSDGGSIALIFTAHYPKKVKSIITEAAHVFVEQKTLEGIAPALEAFLTTDFKKKLSKYHGAQTESVFYGWYHTWNLPDFKKWNIEDLLSKVTAPTLVIQGEKDEYGTLAQVDAIQYKLGSKQTQRIILEGIGHVPHLKEKEQTLKASADFLDLVKIKPL